MSTTVAAPTTDRGPAFRAAVPAHATFAGTLRGEWITLLSLRSTWWVLAATIALITGISLAVAFSLDALAADPPTASGPSTASGAEVVSGGFQMGMLTFAVLGALLITGEYSTGMIRSTLAAVPARLPVLWSKALITGGFAAVLMSVAAIMAFVVGSPLLPDSITALGLGDDGVLRSLLGAGFYLAVVAVLGVALGMLVRSSAGSIAILVGTLLILPGLTSLLPDSWSDAVTPYLPSNAGGTLMSLTPSDGSLSAGAGLAVLLGYAVVALGAAAYRLAKTDA